MIFKEQDCCQLVDELAERSWIGELAANPTVQARRVIWEYLHPLQTGKSITPNSRILDVLKAPNYFDLPEKNLVTQILEASNSRLNESPSTQLRKTTLEEFKKELNEAQDPDTADQILANSIKKLIKTKAIDRTILAQMRGERAIWALKNHHYARAVTLYRKTQNSFRVLGIIDGSLNAMAGEGRALSRAGKYNEAINVFQKAIDEAVDSEMTSNLLLGLGSAHLLEGTNRSSPVNIDLVDKAVNIFSKAIKVAPAHSIDHSFAKLALALALGERGEQEEALSLFDEASAELASLGDERAKSLLERRGELEAGKWHLLGLV